MQHNWQAFDNGMRVCSSCRAQQQQVFDMALVDGHLHISDPYFVPALSETCGPQLNDSACAAQHAQITAYLRVYEDDDEETTLRLMATPPGIHLPISEMLVAKMTAIPGEVGASS